MELEKTFDVACGRDAAVEILCRDETLTALFPEQSEIIDRQGDRRTVRTRYYALGREGHATFHFDVLLDGTIAFEKVCDGNVWRELRGRVEVEEARAEGQRSSVRLALAGQTKRFVPEFTIKGPMEEQIESMSRALAALLDGH